MGKPNKHKRKIAVDGTIYRWDVIIVSSNYDEEEKVLRAFKENSPSNASQLKFSIPWANHIAQSWHADYKTIVAPKDVKHAIRLSIRRGWNPESTLNYELAIPDMTNKEFHEVLE